MPNKKIVITGSSRGIGNHLAKRFLEEGYEVIGISRSQAQIEHPNYQEISADLGNMDEVRTVCAELEGQPIAGLINNAGVHGPIGPFEDTSLDAWFQTFNINLFGAAALAKACVPSLRRQNGFIIF